MEIYETILLFVAGGFSGFLNTLASSGSAISLPALMFIGFEAHVANATNRLALFLGSTTRIVVFQRKKKINWKFAGILLIPCLIGGLTGAWLADDINAKSLGYAVDIALLMALVMIIVGAKRFIVNREDQKPGIKFVHFVLFFLIGGWAGFIVLDSGTYLLMVLVLSVGLDLVKANPVKAVLTFGASIISLALFASHHDIEWVAGLFLSVGSIIGSWAGAHLAVKDKSRKLVFVLLVIVIGGEIISLILERFF